MNHYLVSVPIVGFCCFLVAYCIPVIMSLLNRDLDSDTEYYLGGFCWVLFILYLFSPIVYEFKPLSPEVNQCEIVRDETGTVIELKKGATGFHRPFYGAYKFVTLSKNFETNGTITFPAEGCLVDIPYRVVCSDPMKTYIVSNGKIHNQDFPSSDLPNNFFGDWFADSLKLVLLDIEKQNKFSATPKEIYSWFLDKAKVWSDTNNASCRIEVESFDKVNTSNGFVIK